MQLTITFLLILIAYATNNNIPDYPDYNHKINTQTNTFEKPKLHVCRKKMQSVAPSINIF